VLNCGKPAFDPTSVSTNRGGKCESCFLSELRALLAQGQKKEQQKLARADSKFKKQGYTHRVDAWIHPASGGDDKLVSLYMVNPTDKQIQTELKKGNSCVLNDYKLTVL